MSDIKWKQFQGEIILGCVRWCYKYRISCRDWRKMMVEPGVEVHHTTSLNRIMAN